MNIHGIGMVSALGRGVDSLRAVLENGPVAPAFVDVPFREKPFPVYAVQPETLKDPALLRGARRADRFSKMATLAACDAVTHAGVKINPDRTGIVLGTAFGPHPTVFSFLDDILEFGDAGVSPTLFSHSVHNAAASYISIALDLRGPATTITAFADPFRQSLQVAQNWLDTGTCDFVLVGSVEECGTVMEYIVSQKLPVAEKQMVPFFDALGPQVIPGEGAVFFLLSRDAGLAALTPEDDPSHAPDLWMADFECTCLPESAPVGCWSHLTGSSPLSTAVSCAAGALMIQKNTVYSQSCLLGPEAGQLNRIACISRCGTALTLKK